MNQKIEQKRKREQYVVKQMILLYCHKNHNTKKEALCAQCQDLVAYAQKRSELCPFMEKKTFCSNCKIHCYTLEKRTQIKEVMKFSGPRILCYHPFLALWHVITSVKEKRKNK